MRTYNEYMKRDIDLHGRKMKLSAKYTILVHFMPFKALLSRGRFKRIMQRINDQIAKNNKERFIY